MQIVNWETVPAIPFDQRAYGHPTSAVASHASYRNQDNSAVDHFLPFLPMDDIERRMATMELAAKRRWPSQ